jgi:hypothetical protein
MTIVSQPPKPSKEWRKFCDDLRCPLCGSQLDGNVSSRSASLYCVGNRDEYQCYCHPKEDVPAYERLIFWYPQWQYDIEIEKDFGPFYTRIGRSNMDAAPEHRYKTRQIIFEYSGQRLMFFRQRMEEKDFLKKLALYNTFS